MTPLGAKNFLHQRWIKIYIRYLIILLNERVNHPNVWTKAIQTYRRLQCSCAVARRHWA
jgi:hypothetical protein